MYLGVFRGVTTVDVSLQSKVNGRISREGSTLLMFQFNPGVQIVNGRISGGVSQWTFRCTT